MEALHARSTTAANPDVETSSADYLRRFSGPAGKYFLQRQATVLWKLLGDVAAGRVLDVGGAHGQLAPHLAERGWRVTVHGTSPVCESNLRELHGVRDCSFLLGPLEAIPAPDRGYDLVVAIRLLTHVEDWKGVLAELCRTSSRELVFDFPSTKGINALTPLLFGAKKRYEGNTRTYRNFSRAELEECLLSHGFRPVAWSGQLILPMVLHRMTGAVAPLRWIEALADALGLTPGYGSPVLIRAVREPDR